MKHLPESREVAWGAKGHPPWFLSHYNPIDHIMVLATFFLIYLFLYLDILFNIFSLTFFYSAI